MVLLPWFYCRGTLATAPFQVFENQARNCVSEHYTKSQ